MQCNLPTQYKQLRTDYAANHERCYTNNNATKYRLIIKVYKIHFCKQNPCGSPNECFRIAEMENGHILLILPTTRKEHRPSANQKQINYPAAFAISSLRTLFQENAGEVRIISNKIIN